jgi:ATP-dependent Clp protease, protease subunit
MKKKLKSKSYLLNQNAKIKAKNPEKTKKTKKEKDNNLEYLEYALEYGIDIKNRVIQITNDIEYPLFDFIDVGFNVLEKENSLPITIKINSSGGDVYEAMAVVGRMKTSPCRVITEGYGHVMSAATLILAAGDKRRMSEFCWLMHHEAWESHEGKTSELRHRTRQLENEEKMWNEYMAKFSNKDFDFWANKGIGLDYYMKPQEVLKYGVIDEIF